MVITMAEMVHELDLKLSRLKRLGITDVSDAVSSVLATAGVAANSLKADGPVDGSARNLGDTAFGIKLAETGKEVQGCHLFRSNQSKQVKRLGYQPILSMFMLLVGMVGVLPSLPQIFAMADTLAPKPSTDVVPIEHFRVDEEMGKLKGLSRNLRGGTDPSEVIPELHNAVKSQLSAVQRMHEMYQNGEESALASSIRSLVLGTSEVSDEVSKELKAFTVDDDPSPGLALTDSETSLDLKTIPDSQIIEYFSPSFLSEVVEQLLSFEEILEDVKSILQEPQSISSVPTGEGNDRAGIDGQGQTESANHRRLDESTESVLPPVCTDECAPTDTNCLCQRLANCTSLMTNYDLSVLFANGYIESDSSSSNYGGLSVGASELNVFNVEDNAYNTFNSIMSTAASIDESSTPEECTAFLEQFHQSCDPLSSSGSSSSGSTSSASSAPTCSSANVESFQLSVDEVCENVHSPTKLLLSAIGYVFDGYASDNGDTTYVTSCGEERVSYQSCQTFIKAFEELYSARNESIYPYPNPMRPDPQTPVDTSSGTVLFPTKYTFQQNVYGIAHVALPDPSTAIASDSRIFVIGSQNCLSCSTSSCFSGSCDDSDASQQFSYDPTTYQKWRYNPLTYELSTFQDPTKCMTSNRGYVNCDGSLDMQFRVPSNWLPDISTNVLQSIRLGNTDTCFDFENDLLSLMACNDAASQQFVFDTSTHQIKQGGYCLDTTEDTAFMNADCQQNLASQMWIYDETAQSLKSFSSDNCLTESNANPIFQPCTGSSYQKFIVPFQWKPAISSTSIVDLVLARVNGLNYCMDASEAANSDFTMMPWTVDMQVMNGQYCLDATVQTSNGTIFNNTVYMNTCDGTSSSQQWYYEAHTSHLRHLSFTSTITSTDLRVVADGCPTMTTMAACMNSQDGRDSTYELSDGSNKSFNGQPCRWCCGNECDTNNNKCEPEGWLLTGDSGGPQDGYESYGGVSMNGIGDGYCPDDSQAESNYLSNCLAYNSVSDALEMQPCQADNDDQQFLVPLTWIPTSYLDKMRSAYDASQCMDSSFSNNNNVLMGSCQEGSPGQVFEYNPRTLAIEQSDLCLDYNKENRNVYLNNCEPSDPAQQWYYDYSNMVLYNNGDADWCLNWSPGNDDNQNNLYLSQGCGIGQLNTQWFIPSTWMPEIMDTTPQGRPFQFQLDGYYSRPIPTGIWNGQWGNATEEQCPIGVIQEVLDVCDASMSLLLGDITSLGELTEIAKLVVNNGTENMPPSFEQFAARITITDPSNATQCNNARQQLGYTPDYPFDVEVCQTFYEQECSTLWLSVDGLAGNWSSKGEHTSPAPGGISKDYGTTFKVGYCKIDGSGDCTAQVGGRRLQNEDGANRRLDGTVENPPTWTSTNDSEISARRLDSHKAVNVVADAVTAALIVQSALQLTFDALGYKQGRETDKDDLFKDDHPFKGSTGDYDSELKLKSTYKEFKFGGQKGKTIVKVDKEGRRVNGENKAYADPLDDEDKNPCIQHADLHKTMMQGGGIEVEIVQEPDPRYVECYERQKARQEREELQKKWKEDLWKTGMAVMKVLVYAANVAVGALQTTLGQMSITPNEEFNDSYYTNSTYYNLALAIPWITQSLQTINENIPNGINQGSDYVAGQIDEGTRYVSGLIGTPPTSRRLQDSISYPKDTLHQRLDFIDDFLAAMANDIVDIGEAIGFEAQETNRGKASKKSKKKKKKNMFAQVEDEEHEGRGQDRLLQASLGKKVEAKIDSQNEKIGRLENKMGELAASQNEKISRLENKMSEVAASQNEKINNLEVKIDALSGLMAQLLDATQQKVE
ncbi:hypothetical protein THAOC_15735 [Thalassiosira oceanica]|uniref:Ricin B lectin domain-containing protein n=1 Tax=Thalassiosira oceanica TaxID=159749 RepID=K0SF18_THAOC|nr:hypothetical protein THAOC_15735 [Thalassiosira oceanica]|eukprot:EJK63594.1 hypothetical protein THAOC_15735 [Thalassiosira oceanica]